MLTTTSKSVSPSEEIKPAASSKKGPVVVEIERWRETVKQQGKTAPFASVAAKYEADPLKKLALEAARQKLAPRLQAIAPSTLRNLRLTRGFSQAALATQIDSTQAQIARWESGKTDIQASSIVRLGVALKVDPVELFKIFVEQSARLVK